MSGEMISVLAFAALLILMLLRIPVGIAMGIAGLGGFAAISGIDPALRVLAQSPIRTVTDANFAVIPLFILMSAFATASGMSRELFRSAYTFLGHLRGGLATTTIAASGAFAAICGSSVATAATFSNVAYPEMRKFGYSKGFSTGTIAAGGTLGIMIPPSTVLAVYGLITEQDIGRLFIAAVIPGLLAVAMYILVIAVIGLVRPETLPMGTRSSWAERISSLKDIWAMSLLFIFVIGGIYGGMFTVTEAAGMGAVGAFLISVLRRRLSWEDFCRALIETVRTSAAIFMILIGAMLFGYFLAVSQAPQNITNFLTGSGLGKYQILILILVMYFALGCVMDAMAMIVLTVPIVFPVIVSLGFDPIWFGIIVVMTVELGLITPPVGMNVFVIKSVVRSVDLKTIYKGVMPFIAVDLLRLVLLVAFPILSLWLPSHL